MSGTPTADAPRVFDWLHNKNRTIGMPHLTDEQMASRVRMLMRSDLDHESVCTSARDRIMCLVKEKSQLAERVKTLEAIIATRDAMIEALKEDLIAKLEGTQEA